MSVPLDPAWITPSLLARFWTKVDMSAGPAACWPFRSTLAAEYGRFWIAAGGDNYGAHRVSYLIAHGEIDDRFVCHACDNPRCVNPAHLFLGSHAENMVDSVAKGRQVQARKTHCANGHPLEGPHIRHMVLPDGRRRRWCRLCAAERARAIYARKKAAS